jgi:hypothetical protein
MRSIANKGQGDENIGGVRQILFMPLEFILSMAQLIDGMYDLDNFAYSDVDVKWFMVDYIKESARFTQEQASGPNGPYVKQKVEFKVAKDYAFRFADFAEMQEYEFAVVVVNTNGLALLIGAMAANGDKSGMRFFASTDSGMKYDDRNEIPCYFYKESSKRAAPAVFETEPPIEEPPYPIGTGVGVGTPIGTID